MSSNTPESTHYGLFATLDQVVCAATTFGLGLAAASALDEVEFGLFAIVLTAYYLMSGLVRSLYGEALLVEVARAETSPEVALGAARRIARIAPVAVGVLTVGLLAATHVWNDPAASVALPAGLAVCGFVLSECTRWHLLADNNAAKALALDLLALGLIVTGAIAIGHARPDAPTMVLWWGIAGTSAALVFRKGLRGSQEAALTDGLTFLRRGAHFAGLFLATSGITQMLLLLAGFGIGPATLGAIRGAVLLYGPVGTLLGGLSIWALRSLSIGAPDPSALRGRVIQISLALSGLVVVWSLAVGLLLDRVSVLGDSTAGVRRLLPAVAVLHVVQAGGVGSLLALKARGRGRAVSRAGAVGGTFALALGAVAVWKNSGEGVAWALAAGAAVTTSLAIGALVALSKRGGTACGPPLTT